MDVKDVLGEEPTIGLPKMPDSLLSKIPNKEPEPPKLEIKAEEVELEEELPEEQPEGEKEEKKPEPKKIEEKTKDKIEEEKPEIEEDSIIGAFKTKFGDVEGDFGEDLDGVTSYIEKVLEKEKTSTKQEAIEELLESTPVLKQLKEHLDAGYAVSSFLQQQQMIDWDKVNLKKEDGEFDIELGEEIFKEARRVRGYDEEEVNDAWDLAKDKGNVEEKVDNSKKFLKQEQDKILQTQKDKEKRFNDELKKETDRFIAESKAVIKTGKIMGVTLPTDKAKALEDFSLKVDAKGQTARDKRIASMTLEETLLVDYLLMENFKPIGGTKVPVVNNQDAFRKLKEKQGQKKPNLQGNGLSTDERNKINVKSLFNNN